jgi:uncharacterized protein YciI
MSEINRNLLGIALTAPTMSTLFKLRRAGATIVLMFGLLWPAMADSANEPSTPGTAKTERDIRFVVVHAPGPQWLPGKSMFEQPGLQSHIEHYRRLLVAGKLALGGPYLDSKGGGMMIPAAGVTEEEIAKFAAEDPAVQSGLLVFEVRRWLVGMSK